MAELKVGSMFSDNMVLQRDKQIPVWGVGEPGDEVIVQLAEQRKNVIINTTGQWDITLDPLPAGGPHKLVIESGKQKVEFQNVMVGEVWLCSGQSNMQWKTADVANAEEEIKQASNFSDVRLYLVPKSGADQPRKIINAYWQVCSPETVSEF
ncbi:MAG: sialate O-acetylesterase, partial [Candidatus Sumerlaeia bacterium]|nr:sialate O-acetylesterase [Candidatus Sumerlaeia bacterium]